MKSDAKNTIEYLDQALQMMAMAAPRDVACLASHAKGFALRNHLSEIGNAAGEVERAATGPDAKLLEKPMRHLSEAVLRAERDLLDDMQAA